jgi:hypothetical protein
MMIYLLFAFSAIIALIWHIRITLQIKSLTGKINEFENTILNLIHKLK